MKFICLTFLLISAITDSRSDQYEVLSQLDPVFAVVGEDVILPCFIKPNISIVDMRVEWSRLDLKNSLVHLYENHKDRITSQIQSYRGRTELNHQELQRGNASLKLSSVKVSDEGRYKCLIEFKSGYDDAAVDVKVEAVGSPPVITVDGFDGSGGLHLQCESEGWFPEPDLEWLDSEGVRLSPKTTETHRNRDGFSVKQTITVYHSEKKIHCRVKLRHHMLEAQIIATSNMFVSWRTSVIVISVFVLLSVIAAILIAVFVLKYRDNLELQNENIRMKEALKHFSKHTAVKVTLDADSAHPHLIVSDDRKTVRVEKGQQETRHSQNDGFDECLAVLGKESFTYRCFYFEVQVQGQTEWDLGVTRESANRKGWIRMSPVNGYWAVGLWERRFWALESKYFPLRLRVKPERVGVFVDYEKGFVSFYEVESSSYIYSYSEQSFNENLYVFVSLGYQSNPNPTPLIICDD